MATIIEITEQDVPEKFRNFYNLPHAEFKKRSAEFREWCKTNQVYYYAQFRENFNVYEAHELAAAAGCTKLLLEDMS